MLMSAEMDHLEDMVKQCCRMLDNKRVPSAKIDLKGRQAGTEL